MKQRGRPCRMRAGRVRAGMPGLTLIELMVALAVMAVLGALALPAMGTQMERQRLALAAETLAADLAEARFNAARSGQAMQITATAGSGGRLWCWQVKPATAATEAAPCPCVKARSCNHRTVASGEHPGVKLAQGHRVLVQADGTAQAGTAAVFESPRGERLRVDLLALGRSRICGPAGPLGRYAAC